jgi:hypothetical protein
MTTRHLNAESVVEVEAYVMLSQEQFPAIAQTGEYHMSSLLAQKLDMFSARNGKR